MESLLSYIVTEVPDFKHQCIDVQNILASIFRFKSSTSEFNLQDKISCSIHLGHNPNEVLFAAASSNQTNDCPLSCVSAIFPSDYSCSLDHIEQLRRGFALHHHAVLSAGIGISRNLTLPYIFTLSLQKGKPGHEPLQKPHYLGYKVVLSDSALSFFEFKELLECYSGFILATPQRNQLDYNWLVNLAHTNGYKAEVDIKKFNSGTDGNAFLVLIPKDEDAIFRSHFADFKRIKFGAITESSGNHRFIGEQGTHEISSLLVGDILLKAAQYQKMDAEFRLSADAKCSAEANTSVHYTSLSDIFSDYDLISHSHLKSQFSACTGAIKANLEATPYLSYFSVGQDSRFLVSFETYVCGDSKDSIKERIHRMVFSHQIYGGSSLNLVLFIAEDVNLSKQALSELSEMVKMLEVLQISYRVERHSVTSTGGELVIAIAAVSQAAVNIAPLMGSKVIKGDLIFEVDLSSSAVSSSYSDAVVFDTSNFLEQLLNLPSLKAIQPISRGGVFFTLFSLAEKQNLGFDLTTDGDKSLESFLFCEKLGRMVVVVKDGMQSQLIDVVRESGYGIMLLGHFTKGEIRIDDLSQGFIADLKKKVSFAFQNNPKQMSSKKIVKPYEKSAASKKEQVASMFDNIAHKYDFLNHFLSLGIDKLWRKRLVSEVGKYSPKQILDIATGTGDLAIALSKLKPETIIGLDISAKMVEIGVQKVKDKGLDSMVFLREGDSEKIEFDSNTFDFAAVAFGVRNFENPLKGLTEMHRVIKPGGGIAVLEFAMPTKFPFKQLYKFYFFKILPAIGKLFSKDASAYTYLPESVEAFPSGEKFLELLANAGFTKTRTIPLTFGVANIYIGEK